MKSCHIINLFSFEEKNQHFQSRFLRLAHFEPNLSSAQRRDASIDPVFAFVYHHVGFPQKTSLLLADLVYLQDENGATFVAGKRTTSALSTG